MIQPSAALCVSSHTPIAECVRLMRERDVGSLLIMSPSRPDELQGIFTERDLLKWIDKIQHGGHWEKPVAHLMSRPVVTLPMDRLNEAGPLMLAKRIRHLPIVQGSRRLVGVVSMRDLFAQALSTDRKSASQKPPRSRKKRVLFFSDGNAARAAQARSLGHWTPALWQARDFGSPGPGTKGGQDFDEIESADLAVMDLDGIPASTWAPFLKELNHRSDAPPLILLLSEQAHPKNAVTALKALSRAGKWPVFSKPIALVDFLAAIHELL